MNKVTTTAAINILIGFFSFAVYAENLYNENIFRSYTSDNRARQIGDLLTVAIMENSSATTSTDMVTDRNNDLNLRLGIDGKSNQGGSLQAGSGYDARGRAQRTGRLLAQITVAVTEIRSNGDLVISGKQMLNINDEKQEITLSGVVRTTDIDDSNTVHSSRLAEANIRYAGEGHLTDRTKPSWWSRLIGLVGW